MHNGPWLVVLMAAATLEAGGDALVRAGLHSSALPARLAFLACGALVLFCYGVVVNLPPWDFGRLLGVYVAPFFLVAQVINWVGFGVPPLVLTNACAPFVFDHRAHLLRREHPSP